MSHCLFVSRDIGNTLALVPVADELQARGFDAIFVLDADGDVARSLAATDGVIAKALKSRDVLTLPAESSPDTIRLTEQADFILTALSASGDKSKPTLEQNFVQEALIFEKPVYGIEEVVGGRHNPGWTDLYYHLTALFSALPLPNDHPNVVPVGPMSLKPYRTEPLPELAARGRKKLAMRPHERLIVWQSLPHPEEHLMLLSFWEQLEELKTDLSPFVVAIVRHSRTLKQPIPAFWRNYRLVLRHIVANSTFRLIDASPDYCDLNALHPAAVLPNTRPVACPTMPELVTATASTGVLVGSFNTDVQIVAPYLAYQDVVSIAYLHPDLGGRALAREKGITRLPQPVLWQASSPEQLRDQLRSALFDAPARSAHQQQLVEAYPWPQKPAAEVIADFIKHRA